MSKRTLLSTIQKEKVPRAKKERPEEWQNYGGSMYGEL